MRICRNKGLSVKTSETILKILNEKNHLPVRADSIHFAPVNIALIKYWGKRNTSLNLPITNSLSIALPTKGTTTTIRINDLTYDRYGLNGQRVDKQSEFFKRLHSFCDFFRFEQNHHFDIETENNIPTAAGLASSASGFAALALAFDQLFGWQLEKSQLSILARLGSGSACRSLWNGFVEWERGEREDGLDSFAHPYPASSSFLDSFCVGLLILTKEKKIISSREAMLNSVNTSPSYQDWPRQVADDLASLKIAIVQQDFIQLGEISERNALAMHSTMLDSQPSTNYCTEKTIQYRKKVWELRKTGIPVYFTQYAGPNLKLLFQKRDMADIKNAFSDIEIVAL